MTTKNFKNMIKERTLKKTTRKKKNHGGRVFGHGGYGCVFRPPLKCKNIKESNEIQIQNQNQNVTKLMIKKYAKKEFSEFKKFKRVLKNIPDYNNYFLMNNITLCVPEKLNKEDLKHFNEKCKTLENKNYSESNINDKLDDLLGINMPYGGIDIEDYVNKINFNIQKMKVLNNKLIRLLKNGILKMNQYNVYHGDIKESNILVGKSNNEIDTRIIDWGLSVIYNGEGNIPQFLAGRPIQFNVPFSCILLNQRFKQVCDHFLKDRPNPTKSEMRSLILHTINISKTKHLKLINYTFKNIFKDEYHDILKKNENIDQNKNNKKNDEKIYTLEYNYTIEKIYNYLSKVLDKYIKNGKFHQIEFFKEVYLKNLDIWGFFSVYLFFVEYISIKNSKNNITHFKKNQLKLIDKIKEAYLLILNSADVAIDINTLVKILDEIDPLLNDSLDEENQNKKNNFTHLFQLIDNKKKSSYKTKKRSASMNKTKKNTGNSTK